MGCAASGGRKPRAVWLWLVIDFLELSRKDDADRVTEGLHPARTNPTGRVKLAHLIHRLFSKANEVHKLCIVNNYRCAIPLQAGPRFRPYLSGAGG
jgi:hypothetical protein